MNPSIENISELENAHAAFLATQETPLKPWAEKLQQTAFDEFKTQGFPSTKEDNWRYTNLKHWAQESLAFAGEAKPDLAKYQELFDATRAGLDAYHLVFANGVLVHEWSEGQGLPQGLHLHSAADVDEGLWKKLQPVLEKDWRLGAHGLQSLNKAFMQQLVVIEVDADISIDKPLHIMHLVSTEEKNRILSPRLVVWQRRGAKMTLVESYVGRGEERYFTNSMTDIFVAESASLKHLKIQAEANKANHYGGLNIEQGAASRYELFSLATGAEVLRNDVQCVLAGEESYCSLDGISVLSGSEHVDNFTQIEHQQENTVSREFYKNVVGGKASASFSGKVYVHPEAQKTDAAQTNKNLLTSKQARANTRPQLEIYADDVKCAHGATVGQLDANALFYLRSRGITDKEARRMLLLAFANEVADRALSGTLHDYVQSIVNDRLEHGFGAEES